MSSQYHEDDIISDFFKEKAGVYLDIGAGEPVQNSNTFKLYQAGWRGIVVEPQSCYNQLWSEYRPEDTLLNLAISDRDGEVSMCTSVMEGSRCFYEYIRSGKPVTVVQCLTFSTLIKQYPDCLKADFFTLDVENSERKVLSGINFTIFKPSLICIEHRTRGINNSGEWLNYLSDYRFLAETPANAFYVRK